MDIKVSIGAGHSVAICAWPDAGFQRQTRTISAPSPIYIQGQILGDCRHLKAGGNATNSVASIGLLPAEINVFQSRFPVYVTAYLHYTVLHRNFSSRFEYKNINLFVFQKTRTTLKRSSLCTCCRRVNISMMLVTQVFAYRTINK